MELTDGDDTGLRRRKISGDDRLQCRDDLAGCQDRIDAAVGVRAVAGDAFHGDVHVAGGGVHLAGAQLDIAAGDARFDMECDDRIHRRILHAAGLDHIFRAAFRLFVGLEQQLNVSAEGFGHALQHHRGAQQHGRMHVVTAGVHHAGILTGPGDAAFF